MARRRASMREGPLAELFRATEAAQRQAEKEGRKEEPDPQAGSAQPAPAEPPEKTVEHVPEWAESEAAQPAPPEPVRLPERKPAPQAKPQPVGPWST